jgi:hypothetical protein
VKANLELVGRKQVEKVKGEQVREKRKVNIEKIIHSRLNNLLMNKFFNSLATAEMGRGKSTNKLREVSKMEEKNLKEIVSILKEIDRKINIGGFVGLRGPVADPSPEWVRREGMCDPWYEWAKRGQVADPAPEWGRRGPITTADPSPGWTVRGPVADPGPGWGGKPFPIPPPVSIRGPVADPAPYYLLDKGNLAKLKMHQIESSIV